MHKAFLWDCIILPLFQAESRSVRRHKLQVKWLKWLISNARPNMAKHGQTLWPVRLRHWGSGSPPPMVIGSLRNQAGAVAHPLPPTLPAVCQTHGIAWISKVHIASHCSGVTVTLQSKAWWSYLTACGEHWYYLVLVWRSKEMHLFTNKILLNLADIYL